MADFSTILNDDDDQAVTITLPAEDGEGTLEWEVYPPTSEQLLLFASDLADPARSASAVMEILQDVFDDEQFAAIRKRMRAKRGDPGRLRLNQLTEVIESILEAKADFPTQPSSSSSSSPKPTGARSTGRVRSAALTRSASDSVAS